MIVGTNKDLRMPCPSLQKRFEKAMAWLAAESWKGLPLGKHPIDGDDVFALISEYDSKLLSQGKLETHRVYADVQMVIEGEEWMFSRAEAGLETSVPYNADNDIDFRVGDSKGCDAIHMLPGQVVVLFPSDAHMPGISVDEQPKHIHKLVMKVRMTD